jgi:hypothetical protein
MAYKGEEAADGDGRESCCWTGGVVVGTAAGLPNLASMVGRNGAPKAVERKSEDRSGGEDS